MRDADAWPADMRRRCMRTARLLPPRLRGHLIPPLQSLRRSCWWMALTQSRCCVCQGPSARGCEGLAGQMQRCLAAFVRSLGSARQCTQQQCRGSDGAGTHDANYANAMRSSASALHGHKLLPWRWLRWACRGSDDSDRQPCAPAAGVAAAGGSCARAAAASAAPAAARRRRALAHRRRHGSCAEWYAGSPGCLTRCC